MADVGELQYGLSVNAKDAIKSLQDFVKSLDETEVELGRLDAQSAKTSSAFNKNIGDAALKGSKAVLGFVTAMAAAGAALATFSVKEASEFQSRMSDISTLVDLSTSDLKKFGDQVLELSKTVPVSGSVLSAGLYEIVSAGVSDTADAMTVLEASAKLGVAGLGSTASSVDIMTSALNAFQIDASESANVADILFETVKFGKTTIDDLARSFGQVAPAANAAGVTFEELQAATAALTTSGLQTSVAQTQLRALFIELNREGTKLDKAFESIGITNVKTAVASDGFVKTLVKLKTQLKLTDVDILNLFGSVEAGGAAVSLLGAQNKAFGTTLDALSDSATSLDGAFQKQTETFKSQAQLVKNDFNKALIDAGTKILPVLVDGLKEVRKFMSDNADEIQRFIEGVGQLAAVILEKGIKAVFSITEFFIKNKEAIYILAGAITAALIPAIVSMTIAAAPAIAAITALAAAGGLLAFFGKNIVDGINGLVGGFKSITNSTENTTTAIKKFANEGTADVVKLSIQGQDAFRELSLNGGQFTTDLRDKVINNAAEMSSEFTKEIEKMTTRSTDALKKLFDAGYINQNQLDEGLKKIEASAQQFQNFNVDATKEVANLATEAANLQKKLDDINANTGKNFSFQIDPQELATLQSRLQQTLQPGDVLGAYKTQIESDLADVLAQIKSTQGQITDNALQVAAESNAQLIGISQRFKQDYASIDANQTQAIVQNAVAQRQSVVEEANKQFEGILAAAEQSRLAGSISDEVANKIIDDARNQRDQTVGFANDQTTQIVDAARTYAKEHGLIYDRANNQLLTKQQFFWKGMLEDVKSFTIGAPKTIVEFFKIMMKAFEAGGALLLKFWQAEWNFVKNIVVGVVDGIVKFFTEQVPVYVAKAGELAQAVIDGFAALPGELLKVGKDTIQGFINGIEAQYEAAVSSVSSFGGKIISSIKEKLGIQSPSKVFRELGGFTAEGFLLGFKDGQAGSIAAMTTFVNGLTKEARKIKDKLDFTDAFKALVEVIQNSFGKASDAVREFTKNNADAQDSIRKDLKKTEESITSLKSAFEKDVTQAQGTFNQNAADIIIKAQDDLKQAEADLIQNQTDTNVANNSQQDITPLLQKRDEIQKTITDNLAILKSAGDLQLNLETEIQKQRDFNNLNALQQLAFTFAEEKRQRQEAFDAQLLELETQKQALQTSLDARLQEWNDFTASLKDVDAEFTAAYQEELAKREELTAASVTRLVAEYQRLAAAAQAAKAAGATVPGGGFATGGFTGSGSDTQEAGTVHKNEFVVPAWLLRSNPGLLSGLEALRTGQAPSSQTTENRYEFHVQNNNQGNADMYGDINRMRWMARFAF